MDYVEVVYEGSFILLDLGPWGRYKTSTIPSPSILLIIYTLLLHPMNEPSSHRLQSLMK